MPPKESLPLSYVSIDDFRPGIITNVRTASFGATVVTASGNLGPRLDLPPGAAAQGTTDCWASVTGQLIPLPRGEQPSTQWKFEIDGTPAGGSTPTVYGIVAEPLGASAGLSTEDNVHVFVGYLAQSGGDLVDTMEWWYRAARDNTWRKIKTFSGMASPTQTQTFAGVSTILTRGRTVSFGVPGIPILAVAWSSDGSNTTGGENGSIYFYEVYPDPGSAGSDTPWEETGTVNNTTHVFGGQLIAHSGRILRLCESRYTHGAHSTYYTNERVRYTDPPNSLALTDDTQDTVLDPQTPGPYGAWGSISFGELILIKKWGGALIIQGDIYAPSITRLPGVVPTGNVSHPGVMCSAGMLYRTEQDGIYIWQGGSASTKINKIQDSEFGPDFFTGGKTTSIVNFNNIIYFAKGHVYDPITDSWWHATSPLESQELIWWLTVGDGNQMYGTSYVNSTEDTNEVQLVRWNFDEGSSTYTWISQPIPVSVTNSIDIREFTIDITNVKDDGASVSVSFIQNSGVITSPEVVNVDEGGPWIVRRPVGVRGNNISVKIVADSGNTNISAPTINAIRIGYVEAEMLGPEAES